MQNVQNKALFLLDSLDWYSRGKENNFSHTSLFGLRSPLSNKRGFCVPQVIYFSQKHLLFNWSIIWKSSLSHFNFYPVRIKTQYRRRWFKGPSSSCTSRWGQASTMNLPRPSILRVLVLAKPVPVLPGVLTKAFWVIINPDIISVKKMLYLTSVELSKIFAIISNKARTLFSDVCTYLKLA